ncbi:hypothetical protein OF83DRAFT_1049345 [Amylostereum chailletii]|nr:hypothetical protein OF83DRAFT_1049345 [Amylostereum chailletii]
MLFSRTLLMGFALASSALAANTNPQINDIVDTLSQSIHVTVPAISKLVSSENVTDNSLPPRISELVTAFQTAASDLASTPVSDGDQTDAPTNDDISVTYGAVLSAVAGSVLAALRPGVVPDLATLLAPLDPAIANASTTLNTTLPTALGFVHTLLLDARQFYAAKNFTQTLTALGF